MTHSKIEISFLMEPSKFIDSFECTPEVYYYRFQPEEKIVHSWPQNYIHLDFRIKSL